jgi:hypothetical protein
MDEQPQPQPQPQSPAKKDNAVKTFLVHLAIFIVVNALILVVPVFYDGETDFSFTKRGPMLYGSIAWGVGVLVHGIVVLVSKVIKKS